MNDRQPRNNEPILNINEPAPWVLAIILILCHLGYLLAPQALKETIFTATVLAAQDGVVMLDGRPIGNIATLFTHTLKHGDWAHVLTNAGLILAFGVIAIRSTKNADKPVLGRIKRGPLVFLTIFLGGALLGGLAQWALWVAFGSTGLSVGASTGGAALFASAGWALGGKERMMGFIVIMMAIDAFVIFVGGAESGLHDPAWAGHLGGFIAGAILAPKLIDPYGANFNRFR